MHFWLQHGDLRFTLPQGESVIGRSRDAAIVLKDKLVSRRHARLAVHGDQVMVEDLSSGNGVFINGNQIRGATPLHPGDTLFVGRNRLELGVGAEPPAPPGDFSRRGPLTDDEGLSTRREDALDLLGGIAEHALQHGRLEEAEATVATYLNNFLQNIRVSNSAELGDPEKVAAYALKLAEATRKGSWIDYVCQLYTMLGRPLPLKLIDTLERVLVSVRPENPSAIVQYVAALRAIEQRFHDDELALLARLDVVARS